MFDCKKAIKKCKAICCYYVPLPKEFWEKHKKKAQAKTLVLKWDEKYILPLTEDMRCPFVGKDFRCVVYSHRIWLCKLFGTINTQGLRCPWLKADGSKRGKRKREKLKQQNDDNLIEIKGKIEREIKRALEAKKGLDKKNPSG